MSAQPELWGDVRLTDPWQSVEGARRAQKLTRRAQILALLYRWDRVFGASVSTIDADRLVEALGGQRNCWSKRLGEAADAGLLERDETTMPLSFRLTRAGRDAARELAS